MRFHEVTSALPDKETIEKEYRNSREIGAVRIGEDHLFFRLGLKHYGIPYTDIKKCFRRVNVVPMKMCCANGEMELESLIIANEEKELAQVPLPGTRAARELMKELKKRMPDTDFSAPAKPKEDDQLKKEA
ncbi:MAG: hypothetical protein J6P45_08985 [Lachnospiraceae bacterium]|nr:hypothetical protein [Lachnospiraceae bacterium]